MALSDKQEQMCSDSKWDFSDLKAMFLNCTLKKSSEISHTQGLIDISMAIMEKNGVSCDCLRPVDYDIATGVWPDMTELGWDMGRRMQIRFSQSGIPLGIVENRFHAIGRTRLTKNVMRLRRPYKPEAQASGFFWENA